MVELSDKIIEKMRAVFDDSNIIDRLIEYDVNEISRLREQANIEKDEILDELISKSTMEEIIELQQKEINRKFKHDLYTCLVGNMTVEELENKYCKNEKGLK